MSRTLGLLVVFIVFAGCEKTPVPAPIVAADTQTDLRHAHKHLHGDPHRHDHEHDDDFTGSHAHPHTHGHRHAASPHDGAIVSLHWVDKSTTEQVQSRFAIPAAPHVEIMADFPQQIRFSFLSETAKGGWTTWDLGERIPVVEFASGDLDLRLAPELESDEAIYSAALPKEFVAVLNGENEVIRLGKLRLRIGEHSFVVAEDLVYREGELDAVLN